MIRKGRILTLILLVLVLFSAPIFANGNSEDGVSVDASGESAVWPSGPITIVCPSRAGGFADYHARVFADYLQRETGESVIVENIAEGGGTVGYEKVRSEDPNGLTLMYYHSTFPIGCYTGMYKYDPDTAFTPVSSVVNAGNNAIVVSASSPWNTLEDLMNDAKKNPEKIKWGTQTGGTSHFMMAMFEQAAGVKFKMVDAGSEADKITALLGGHIDICNIGMPNTDQYVKAGKLKALCVTGSDRDFAFPDFPTAVEQGYDVVISLEFTVYGPLGMSSEMVGQINDALDSFGTTDSVSKEAVEKQGAYVIPRSTEETLVFMKKENAMLKNLAKAIGF